MRVSTIVLIVAFLALFWVYHNFEPRPAANEAPTTAVVPPGFVPDPNYTWVPRTNVRRPREPETTTTTTTTSPTETTTTTPEPTTTVIDPDGGGPLPPVTVPVPPTIALPTLPLPGLVGPALTTEAPTS